MLNWVQNGFIFSQNIFFILIGMALARDITVVMKHWDQKQGEEEWVYLAYTSTSYSITEGCQYRNWNRAAPDAEAREECCLLSCSLELAQPAFL